MSTPQETTPSKPVINPSSRQTLIHNVALGALIVCPLIIAIPPRKLDLYTIALLSGTFVGGNQLAQEYTGRSILTRVQDRMESISAPKLPSKALEVQAKLREERAMREGLVPKGEDVKTVLEEIRKKEQEKKERGLLEKVWMGAEGNDWKEKRDQKEKEALEDGRGYGGLIVDQIWEVWNWGKDQNEEVKEIDKKVIEEQKRRNE